MRTGHNPMGSWVIIVMLLIIALQTISGLFVTDDIFSDGPYRSLVSPQVQETMASFTSTSLMCCCGL